MKLVSNGELGSRKVGSPTRLITSDVLRFLRERHARQMAAFHDLRDLLDA